MFLPSLARAHLTTNAVVGACLASWTFGCGPSVLWYGHDDRRAHEARVVEEGEHQVVYLDGRVVGRHDAVGFEALRFGRNGNELAYPAKRGSTWQVFAGGQPGRAWDAIANVVWFDAEERVAYVAQDPKGWYVVAGRSRSGPWDAVLDRSVKIADDGPRAAFVAIARDGTFVVEGTRAHGPFDGVADLGWLGTGRVAFRARIRESSFVQLGDQRDDRFEAIDTLVVSQRSGEAAYVGRRGGAVWVVLPTGDMGPYDAVEQLALGPGKGQWAYAARVDRSWFVVSGGKRSRSHTAILPGTVAFSPSGRHVIHAARDGREVRLFVDDDSGPAFDEVETPAFDERETIWGYIGRKHGASHVVVGSRTVRREPHATSLVLSPSGKRHAYIATRSGSPAVVVDGVAHRFALAVSGTLVFDEAGRHWACLVAEAEGDPPFITIDGRRRRRFDVEELVAAAMQLPAGSAPVMSAHRLTRWVSAELALALREP